MCHPLSLSYVQLLVTPQTVACQAPLSMGILEARILEWVAIPLSRDIPNPGIKPRSPALQADSLPYEPPGESLFFLEMVDTLVFKLSDKFYNEA